MTMRPTTTLRQTITLALISLVLSANLSALGREPPSSYRRPLAIAVLAGGCFWGVEAVFEHVTGVVSATSGYSGGTRGDATYDRVSSGATGHAEAVQITFDPEQVSFDRLLEVFFSVVHDPTQLNRQGPDIGPQYRSAIFFVNAEQKRQAEAAIARLTETKAYDGAIVTRVDSLVAFYPAEEEHQDFAARNPRHPYIVIHDAPKVAKLKKAFPRLYRERPASS